MARIVGVHGIGQQFKGGNMIRVAWLPALQDGLDRVARKLVSEDDFACVFYGDLFRPPGKSAAVPPLDASDVSDPFERELLQLWQSEALRAEGVAPSPAEGTKVGIPQLVQRGLNVLSRSRFFAGIAERSLIYDLKQVRWYFSNPEIRRQARARVEAVIRPDTTVILGHSLGSVVAYEALCAHPEWGVRTFITLGSPLGIRNLIFDRLAPAPQAGRGAWPGSVSRWVNIADSGDVVALVKRLASCFGPLVVDQLIDNGARAHEATSYLTSRELGEALANEL